MARQLMRRIGSVTYQANGISILDLPRNHVYKGLVLHLAGLFTVAGGTTDGTLHDEQPQSLIREIRIVRNGSEVLQTISGATAYRMAHWNYGAAPIITALGSAGVQANTAFSVFIPIDFWSPRLKEAFQSMSLLRSVGATSLTLEIAWGNEGSLVAGGDRTETLSNVTLLVYGNPEIMDLTGDFLDKNIHPILVAIPATTSALEVDLPTGPLYRKLWLKTSQQLAGPLAGSEDFDVVNGVVNSLRLQLDGQLILADNLSWDAIRAMNKQDYSLEAAAGGYAVIDFARDGNIAGFLETQGASDFRATFDVTVGIGITRLRIFPETYIGAKVAQR